MTQSPNRLHRLLLERLTRSVVYRRRLSSRFGSAPLYVSPASSLSFLKPNLVSDLFDFAELYVDQGDVVWDIGANVGLLSISAAHRAGSQGQIVSVEADLFLVSLLRRSAAIQSNKSAPIKIIPAAIHQENGVANFLIAKSGGLSTNHLASVEGSTWAGGVRESVHTLTISLDWLLNHVPSPSVLKIDIEGAEVPALLGAENLLSTVRPIILIEVFAKNALEASEVFHKHNYDMYDWDSRARSGARGNAIERAAINTLAIPRERAAR